MTAVNRETSAVATISPESASSDRELVANRIFDASRELVF